MAEKHLPVYGVGPYMVIAIVLITLAALILTYQNLLPNITTVQLNALFRVMGIISIIMGIVFWLSAVTRSRIDDSIRSNDLVTTGIYGYVRHPIYVAFLYMTSGIIMIYGNILLFILPFFFWAFFTVTLKKTEEKWLIDLYGEDYITYSRNVNRFIPKVI